jgi:hypothetical protein
MSRQAPPLLNKLFSCVALSVVLLLPACDSGGDDETAVVIPSINFGTPVNLSSNAGISVSPAVAIGSVLVAWEDTTPGNSEIFVARSTDGGVSFGTPVNISNNAGASVLPAVAISGSTVLVAWADTTPGGEEIFVARSTDDGVSFGTPVNLSSNATNSYAPAVVISGSTVLVAWVDNDDIVVARSTDGGVSFGTPVNLSNNAGISETPAVVISGNTVLVAWDDDTPGNSEIFVARSTDGGVSFGTPVNLSSNAGNSYDASMVISGSSVLVAWDDDTPGNSEIFVARSTDGGVSFGTPVNLSSNAGISFAPVMVISGSTVLVAWYDNTPGNYEILLARSQ